MTFRSFRIRGIEVAELLPLVGLSDEALHARNARRVIADKRHAYPDRVELRDAEPGEALLLLNYWQKLELKSRCSTGVPRASRKPAVVE